MMAYSALAGILLFAVLFFDYWSYCYLSINCWIFSFDNSSHCPTLRAIVTRKYLMQNDNSDFDCFIRSLPFNRR